MADVSVDLRPRSTGEVLDDAWRLALADAGVLLTCSALFLVPAFCALLLLLARPAPAGAGQLLLPVLLALLLPLTGLGSGACQEVFRRRVEGRTVSLDSCLRDALRRTLEHAAARAVVVVAVVAGLMLLVMPGLTVWASVTPVHALIVAGRGRTGTFLRELGREATFDPAKAVCVTLCRLPLLLLAVLNLHLLLQALLWVGDNLAGMDTALLSVEMSLTGNAVYRTALVLLCWLLLSPFFEASNFLLHLDARTRQEGLDLFYRVQRVFPAAEPEPSRRGVAVALAVASLVLLASPLRAADASPELDAVRVTRAGVEAVRDEVKAAEPYPGGARWEGRLRGLSAQLERTAPRRYDWFPRALDGFADRNRDGALHVLGDLQRRLSLAEETLAPPEGAGGRLTPDDIKSKLRREGAKGKGESAKAEEKKRQEEEREKKDVERDQPEPPKGRGARVSAPVAAGGMGSFAWTLLAGLAVAVLIVAGVLYFNSRGGPKTEKKLAKAAPKAEAAAAAPRPEDGSPSELWRRAEALADVGQHLEAVRLLYLAVLFQLDRKGLLRYEPTRTNGEYVRQVRLSEQAPPELHAPFEHLTVFFELKWYGEHACDAGEYRTYRGLAEEVRAGAGAA
jgi:hypothetical protein